MNLPRHANDPANDHAGITDLCDIAHQRIVTRLVEGDTICKVKIEDVFDSLIQKRRHVAIELLVRLCGNAFLPSKDKDEDLERDCAQVLHDFVEADDNLRDSMLDEMEQEAIEEAMNS